jgi:hypothetical protein
MKLTITKAQAASGQLEVAIELLFADRDPLAVRTLSTAALTILADLVEHQRPGESWRTKLIEDSGFSRQDAIKVLNSVSNFLKHADRDPDADLSFEEEENDHVIFFATLESGELGYPLSLNMQAFQIWYLANHLEQFGEDTELVRKAKTAFPDLTLRDRQGRLKAGAEFLPEVHRPSGNVA